MENQELKLNGKKENFKNENASHLDEDQLFLISAQKNKKYKIEKIIAGQSLTQRLCSIGIVPGEIIFINDISNWGPITVVAKGVKIALGRGVACKILLRKLKS